jgi:undecaprenyl-diphosphatase
VSDLVRALILGIVEGATEFIPVSSTGHLILVGHWLGFVGERANVFEIVIQLGAILAVIWQYRAMLGRLAQDVVHPTRQGADGPGARRLILAIGIAFLPAAMVGFLTHKWITAHLFNPRIVAWALVVGGILMWVIESLPRIARVDRLSAMPYGTALGIGVAQVASLVPGVSRSASTIMGALLLGVARPAAAEFSFLLAIPVMFAATALGLASNVALLRITDIPIFAVGFVTAFASALVAIRFLVRFVARHDFRPFALYRIVLGAVLLTTMS